MQNIVQNTEIITKSNDRVKLKLSIETRKKFKALVKQYPFKTMFLRDMVQKTGITMSMPTLSKLLKGVGNADSIRKVEVFITTVEVKQLKH